MKNRFAWFTAVTVACAALGVAWAAKKEIVTMTPEDLKWIDVPNAGGAQVANITGDIFKGAHTAIAKVPAGQVHPLHTHTSEVKAVVVSGTFSVTPEGGVEKKLGPGSYFAIPGGVKHLSSCAPGAPCVLFQQGTGKFDMKPVAEKAAAEKPASEKPAEKK
jgi:quercetin dioxygenase-like cupin family protein